MMDRVAGREEWLINIVGVERVEPHSAWLTTVLNVAMEDGREIPAVLAEVVEAYPAMSDEPFIRSMSVARDKQGELLPQLLINTDLGDPSAGGERDHERAASAVDYVEAVLLDEIAVMVETRRRQAKRAEEQVRRELAQ